MKNRRINLKNRKNLARVLWALTFIFITILILNSYILYTHYVDYHRGKNQQHSLSGDAPGKPNIAERLSKQYSFNENDLFSPGGDTDYIHTGPDLKDEAFEIIGSIKNNDFYAVVLFKGTSKIKLLKKNETVTGAIKVYHVGASEVVLEENGNKKTYKVFNFDDKQSRKGD